MPGLLDTAISGLQTSQTALRTTGHNIANANTPGYSRQRVEISTTLPNQLGSGFVGTGVKLDSIQRTADEFVIAQLRKDTTLAGELDAFHENVRQLDTLLSDPSTGLSSGLDQFFAVMENGADDPTSIPSRQLVISEAGNLVNRFNTLYESVFTISENVNSKLEVSLSQINALASNIANLNDAISLAGGIDSTPPNDLLDQREEAMRQLSELVAIGVVAQDDGQVNISIGSGQALVVGSDSRELGLVDGQLDPIQKDIAYLDGTGSQVITSLVSGGEVGGLLNFRSEVLSTAFNELGRVALVMAAEYNDAHSRGIDLNNQFGGLFFQDVNDPSVALSRVLSSGNNALPDDRIMSLELLDATQLTSSDYLLATGPNDTSYRITRQSDGEVVFSGSLPANPPQSIEFDGLRLNFTSGTFQPGDQFLIQPTRTAAKDIALELERPDQLAFASPLSTQNDSGNTGNATIDAGSLTSLTAPDGSMLPLFANEGEMSPPLVVVFTSPTTYDVLDNSDPANPQQLNPPIRNQTYIPGAVNPLFSQDSGETMVVAAGTSLGITGVSAGAAPLAPVANGYPAETFSVNIFDPETSLTTTTSITTSLNDSARSIASQLSNLSGVSVNARNSMELSGFDDLSGVAPLQLNLNGVDLIEYDGPLVLNTVPDPSGNPASFSQYLAERINEDSSLQALGIYAVSGTNTSTGEPELRVFSSEGDDFNVTLEAGAATESLVVTDYNGSSATLAGAGAGNEETVTVGGTFDITLASNRVLSTTPTVSLLVGDSSAANFAQSSYLGIAASISGIPDTGDRFTLDFNTDGISDNRNALNMVNLSGQQVVDGEQKTFADSYGVLVELIGIETNAAQINLDAAEQVLTQTQNLRDSISGVNLDEEASRLIQLEQAYNANAQVISIARDIFERLINSF
ncbi:flagellar hook-associated protein FlgK [Pseudomaricurvus alkylphenolicus]|uniref:flagellar hook-associated protein FlgK n=1 Tax=Pseudomaricurvus alkylphenolicus TaxID=1306991 RepID=UPI001420F44A|nr:flagellar hook-associated protein FlgK [Pseudomaricurvus alkylphenolicus]NIB43251.1 flagellar hook-associated protein FlgK [Pseudomaricurvus alkylphenolicus]